MSVKFLINPLASVRRGTYLWDMIKDACHRLGYVEDRDFALEWTRSGQTVEQAYRAATAWDRIVAVGGDGTTRAVAEGIHKSGTGAALGVIPQGTGNDFARALGLYHLWRHRRTLGMAQVIRWLSTGPTVPVDVLTANARHCFVSYCSVGFDAEVSCAYARLRRHPVLQALLQGRIINECAYALLALRYAGRRLPGLHCQLRMRDASWTTVDIRSGTCALIVSNLSSYGGGAILAGSASFQDGLFEVTQISHLWIFLLLMVSRVWPRLRQACHLESWQARELQVPLPMASALQVDGEDSRELLAGGAGLSVHVAGQIQVVAADLGRSHTSARLV